MLEQTYTLFPLVRLEGILQLYFQDHYVMARGKHLMSLTYPIRYHPTLILEQV